jgi:hypothetical protein
MQGRIIVEINSIAGTTKHHYALRGSLAGLMQGHNIVEISSIAGAKHLALWAWLAAAGSNHCGN